MKRYQTTAEKKAYRDRVLAYEAQGLTTSDAQGVVDAEQEKENKTMSPPTPGPWIAEPNSLGSWRIVATGTTPKLVLGHVNTDANARLIAQAPALREALKRAVLEMDAAHTYLPTSAAMHQMDEAIKQAEHVLAQIEEG